MFLLSPVDWALIETWKDSGVPLEAVLKGIDRAFEKWHARRNKTRLVNALAYCTQEVLTAAREAPGETPRQARDSAPIFTPEELSAYLRSNAEHIRQAGDSHVFRQSAESLEQLAAKEQPDLEALEQRLTVLEERLLAAATETCSEEQLLQYRQDMNRQLAPYRRKMTAPQISLLEKQYLRNRILEAARLPRLSLFYL